MIIRWRWKSIEKVEQNRKKGVIFISRGEQGDVLKKTEVFFTASFLMSREGEKVLKIDDIVSFMKFFIEKHDAQPVKVKGYRHFGTGAYVLPEGSHFGAGLNAFKHKNGIAVDVFQTRFEQRCVPLLFIQGIEKDKIGPSEVLEGAGQ